MGTLPQNLPLFIARDRRSGTCVVEAGLCVSLAPSRDAGALRSCNRRATIEEQRGRKWFRSYPRRHQRPRRRHTPIQPKCAMTCAAVPWMSRLARRGTDTSPTRARQPQTFVPPPPSSRAGTVESWASLSLHRPVDPPLESGPLQERPWAARSARPDPSFRHWI